MSQENTVSFKVFLQSEQKDGKPEVRRFGIDRDVVSNFTYLSEKLQSVFPVLRGKVFSVTWRDEDEDEVLISSDDELMIALTEIKGDVRKLSVVVKGDTTNTKQEKINSSGKVHSGVVCDGCESAIIGYRYKCIECPNYDLCSSCEGKELHSEHFMVRIPVPMSWRPHFGKRLAHHLSKSAQKHASHCGEEAAAGGRGRHCSFAHAHPRIRHANWVDALTTFLGEWVAVASDDEAAAPGTEPDTSGGQNTTGSVPKDAQQKQKPTESGKASKPAAASAEGDSHTQYLMNVGRAVASFLDPLGIDVDVLVNTTSAENSDSKAEKQAAGEKEHSAPVSNTAGNSEASNAEKSSQDGEGSERESPEKDGWTVVGGDAAAPGQADSDIKTSEEKTDTAKEGGAESAASSVADVMESARAAATAAMAAAHDAARAAAATAAYDASRTAAGVATPPSSSGAPAPATGAVPKVGFPMYYPPPPSFSTIASTFPTLPPPPPTFGNQWSFATPAPPFALGGAYAMLPNNQSRQPAAYPQQQQQQQQQPLQQQTSQSQRTHPLQQQQQQQQALHPDPRVAQALQDMMAMGFSNEGGWLSQLLEMKEGDIEKALDVLQPVKKN